MREVVNLKLRLVAVTGDPVGCRHDTGIAHQHGYGLGHLYDGIGSLLGALQGSKVEPYIHQITCTVGCDGCLFDPLHNTLRFGLIATCHHNRGPSFVESLGHFLSEASTRTGDDGQFAVEAFAEASGDLTRRSFETEAICILLGITTRHFFERVAGI